LFASR
jgi:DNA-binding transcriptional LysR family regulator